MNPITRFIKAFRLGFQTLGGGGDSVTSPFFGQNFSLWNDFWSGKDKTNYANEVGDLRTSTLVMAGYQWVSQNTASARLRAITEDADNKQTETDHPLIDLFYRPNDYYGFEELISGLSYSWLTAATAYLIVNLDGTGQPAEIFWEPDWTIKPYWEVGSKNWIDGYEVNRDGKWIKIPNGKYDSELKIIMFRRGLNPETRKGLSPLSALISELFTEKQAARFMNQLLKNGLVPPVVVSLGDKDNTASREDALYAQDSLARKMRGEDPNIAMFVNKATTVNKLGFDYNSMGLREVRQVPEERFCSAMGISPYSLHFGTSRAASTFSNVEQYLKYDYRSYIVPFQRYIAGVLNRELMPLYGESDVSVGWDHSDVYLMQADVDAQWERIGKAYQRRILNRAQALDGIGYKFDAEDEETFYPVIGTMTTDQPIEPTEPVEPIVEPLPGEPKALKGMPPAGEIDAAVNWWDDVQDADGAALIKARAN